MYHYPRERTLNSNNDYTFNSGLILCQHISIQNIIAYGDSLSVDFNVYDSTNSNNNLIGSNGIKSITNSRPYNGVCNTCYSLTSIYMCKYIKWKRLMTLPLLKCGNDVCNLPSTQDVPRINLRTWISNTQCIKINRIYWNNNILQSDNETNTNWYIWGRLRRLLKNGGEKDRQDLETPLNQDNTINYNAIYCLYGYPEKDETRFRVQLELKHLYKDTKFWLGTDDINIFNITGSSDNVNKVKHYLKEFKYGNVSWSYVQSCDIGNPAPDNVLLQRIDEQAVGLSSFNLIFISTIGVIGFICILLTAYFSSQTYPLSDPVNYFAILWIVLELWDFESDVIFALYLYYLSDIYQRDLIYLIFILSVILIGFVFILNLSYFRYLTSLWLQKTGAGVCRHWLGKNWLYVFFLVVICGSVHPAIELVNSLLVPKRIFSMHLPYSELVKMRTDRFLIQVLFENVPFLFIQVIYYITVSKIEPDFQSNNAVFFASIISSCLSVLFSATYYFAYKSEGNWTPIAMKKFKFRLKFFFRNKTDSMRRLDLDGKGHIKPKHYQNNNYYIIHSHWRFQSCIAKAYHIQTPSLVVIDKLSVHEFDGVNNIEFDVHGRILKDTRLMSINTLDTAGKVINRESIDNDCQRSLIGLLQHEFSLENSHNDLKVKIKSYSIKKNKQGELLYDLKRGNTIKSILCCCFKSKNDEIQANTYSSHYNNIRSITNNLNINTGSTNHSSIPSFTNSIRNDGNLTSPNGALSPGLSPLSQNQNIMNIKRVTDEQAIYLNVENINKHALVTKIDDDIYE